MINHFVRASATARDGIHVISNWAVISGEAIVGAYSCNASAILIPSPRARRGCRVCSRDQEILN